MVTVTCTHVHRQTSHTICMFICGHEVKYNVNIHLCHLQIFVLVLITITTLIVVVVGM